MPKRRVAPAPRRSAVVAPTGSDVPADPDAAGTVVGRFPVQGAYSFGGRDARFGVGRPGHVHQGQDVPAASGTPIVAPVAGTIIWKANQPGGAGIYLVLRASSDGRDYVFMHLKRGSVLVAPDQAVTAGQQLAEVGATGIASGPHLHFEIWIGGWQARGGAPIDPLPQLERWAGS
ncbi:M23 family metallopeptidase [Conexibacter sp. CPCC 206217]|uniref:M23 family metallopeptidase n=1 Tax=Conexibacter sp. CPCC 206217 TaxID=3064574 RepID=UPI0027181DCA|nr:M23 family metallopeptidase [Conexibacter sp. CPCC 206217]MDO8210088.1 M23 family metallopeptidase [Conexibacter sp. CPCC 206217]